MGSFGAFYGFSQVPFQPAAPFERLAFDQPFAALLVGFALFALAMLVVVLLSSLHERLTFEGLVCPIDGLPAKVLVRRDTLGRAIDIVRCTLQEPPGRIACGKACLGALRT